VRVQHKLVALEGLALLLLPLALLLFSLQALFVEGGLVLGEALLELALLLVEVVEVGAEPGDGPLGGWRGGQGGRLLDESLGELGSGLGALLHLSEEGVHVVGGGRRGGARVGQLADVL